MNREVKIDGAYGEGGGQILRSALTLSLLSGRTFSIANIRAQRSKPGLRPQHLAAVTAAAHISGGRADGASIGSMNLRFMPGAIQSGDYSFEVPTAGAMPLVLQTIFLPLAQATGVSRLEFKGGTHVPWAPVYEYLELVWGKTMQKLGLDVKLNIREAGYYPKGNGRFEATITPGATLKPIQALDFRLQSLTVVGVLSRLPRHIVEREFSELEKKISGLGLQCRLDTKIREYPACQPGNTLVLAADFGHVYAGFSSLGKKGKPAERVASDLAKVFRRFVATEAPVDTYLADQLLLPLSFACDASSYRTAEITRHLLTNADIICKFCNADIRIDGKEGKPGVVEISPTSTHTRS